MNAYIKLFLTAPLWAAAFIAGQIVVHEIPPMDGAFLRFFIASVAMIGVLLWRRHKKIQTDINTTATINSSPLLPQGLRDILLVFLCGFVGVFLYNAVFMIALQSVNATRAATIVPTNPVVLVILAWLFYGEPLGWKRLFGILCAVGGAILVVSKGDLSAFGWHSFSLNDLWLLAAIACWVLYVLISKPLMKRYSALEFNAWAFVVGTVFLGLALIPPFDIVTPAHPLNLMNISLKTWLSLVVMGIGSSVLAFLWYFEGMREVGIIRAAVFISLIPVMAMIEAWLFLNQNISPADWLGALMVGIGIYLVNMPSKK